MHLLELILKLRQICTHPLLCKNYEELLSQTGMWIFVSFIIVDDTGVTWDQKRAVDLLGLLKDTGDDNCCSCGSCVDEIDFVPFVTKCGHLYVFHYDLISNL